MLKKHRKNTFTMALLVGISAISLASLGYSMWVAGMQNKTYEAQTTINMDFAVNNTVVSTVTATKNEGRPNTIRIDSSSASNNDSPLGKPEGEIGEDRDLNNAMTIELVTSNNTTVHKVTGEMSVKTGVEARKDLNIVPNFADTSNGSDTDKTKIGYTPIKIKDTDTKDIFDRPLNSDGYFVNDYTFLELSKTVIDVSELTKTTYISGYDKYTYDGSTFEFVFGSFFGTDKTRYEDPEAFYNTYIIKYKDAFRANPTEENKITYLKSIEAAKNELNLMYRLLNGSTITVLFTVDCEFDNTFEA